MKSQKNAFLCLENSQSILKTFIESFKIQQQLQKKTMTYFQKLQRRDQQIVELLKSLRSDFSNFQLNQKEYNLKKLKNSNIIAQLNKSILDELCLRRNEGIIKKKSNQFSNQIIDITSMKFDDNLIQLNTKNGQVKSSEDQRRNSKIKPTTNKNLLTRVQSKRNLLQSMQYSQTNIKPSVPKSAFIQKQILVPFYEDKLISYYDYNKFKEKIATWTGQLYTQLSQITYNRYSKKQFSKDEMKVFFTSNLILNSVKFMNFLIEKYPYLWKIHKIQILQEYDLQAKNILKYLMQKYPIKKRGIVDHSIEQVIKVKNDIINPENNSLRNSEIYFEYNNQKQYDEKIKVLINVFTRNTLKNFKDFRKEMEKIFSINHQVILEYQNINNQILNKNTPQSPRSFIQFRHLSQQILEEQSKNQNIPNNNQIIKESHFKKNAPSSNQSNLVHVKQNSILKIVKHEIGMKFKQNSPLYSEEQIRQRGVKIKTPQTLRIIMKWIEALQNKLAHFNTFLINKTYSFANKYDEDIIQLNANEIEILKQKLKESIEKHYSAREYGNTSEIRLALSQLSNFIEKNKQQFNFIPENQSIVGLSTYILSDPISKLTINYLQTLIHCLLQAQNNFNKQSKKNPISLLAFGVYDLLRAKCSGTKQQIQEVYKNLLQNKVFKIVRVKNRLQSLNRDFLINIKYRNSPLICQLQLSIADQKQQEEQKCKNLNLFSHFLYELERSQYGPLTQAVITNNHLNSTISYFEDQMKNITINTLNIKSNYNKQKKEIEVEGYEIIKIDISFTCNNCWKFKYANQSFLNSFEQVLKGNKQNSKKLCGLCAFLRLTKEQKKRYLLEQLADIFEELRVDQIKKLKRNQNYICIITHEIKKSIKILEKIDLSEQENKILFCQTFFSYVYPCDIYEIQELNIAYAFKLKQNIDLISLTGKQLSQKNITFNNSLTRADIKDSDRIICCKLKQNKLFALDKQYNKEQSIKKLEEIRNLRYLIEHLKYQSNPNKPIKQKLKEVINGESIRLKNSKLISINFIKSRILKNLNISENNIKIIDFSKFHFDQIQQLNISFNQLSKLNLNKCSLMNLKKIYANNNNIYQVNMLESNLSSLTFLSLAYNNLTQCNQIINLNTLSELHLNHNKIQILNFNKFKSHMLTILYISYNYIKYIYNLNCVYNLQIFDISNNFLINIDFNDCQLKSLKKLDLQANRLNSVSGLESLINLKQLYLSYNYLQRFEFSGLPYTKLQKLHICFNKLQNLNYDKNKIKNLKEFYIYKNRLKQLKDEFNRIGFKMIEKKSIYEYSDNQILKIFNWILNILSIGDVQNIIQSMKEVRVLARDLNIEDPLKDIYLNQITLPFFRYHCTEVTHLREILNQFMPDDNHLVVTQSQPKLQKASTKTFGNFYS